MDDLSRVWLSSLEPVVLLFTNSFNYFRFLDFECPVEGYSVQLLDFKCHVEGYFECPVEGYFECTS